MRDPLVRGQPQLLTLFFFSLGSVSLGLILLLFLFFLSHWSSFSSFFFFSLSRWVWSSLLHLPFFSFFFSFSHSFISKTNIIPSSENATSTFKPRTYGINKNPMNKVNNPQSIKANEIPNIKYANPFDVICATTISVDDRLDTNAVADLVVVIGARDSLENEIGAGEDRRILRTRADSSWKTLDC